MVVRMVAQARSKSILFVIGGIALALLLPTPILVAIAGSWLGWAGVRRFRQPKSTKKNSRTK